MTKRIVAKVTKAANDLVGGKIADKRFFYIKHKNYFQHNNKYYAKFLLYEKWYIKRCKTCWKKIVNNPLDL